MESLFFFKISLSTAHEKDNTNMDIRLNLIMGGRFSP